MRHNLAWFLMSYRNFSKEMEALAVRWVEMVDTPDHWHVKGKVSAAIEGGKQNRSHFSSKMAPCNV